jgi:hypothetical protein
MGKGGTVRIAVFILFFITLLSSTLGYAFDIARYCRTIGQHAGGSYQIEKSCRDMEYEAKAKLARMTIPPRIKRYCQNIGQHAGGSYNIMLSCVEMELEAKRSMQ